MLRILVNLPKLGNACSGSPAAAAASGGESVRRIRAQRYGAPVQRPPRPGGRAGPDVYRSLAQSRSRRRFGLGCVQKAKPLRDLARLRLLMTRRFCMPFASVQFPGVF